MFKELINKDIVALLKQYGFKKQNLTWNRSLNGITQVINFQLSSYNNENIQQFTINLGVFYPQLWRINKGEKIPKFITEFDCFPRERIGYIKNNKDLWWTINNETDVIELSKEIKKVIEDKCIPFLDKMRDYHEVSNFYSCSPKVLLPIEKIYLAIIRNILQDLNTSEKLLKEVSKISENWANKVKEVNSRLN